MSYKRVIGLVLIAVSFLLVFFGGGVTGAVVGGAVKSSLRFVGLFLFISGCVLVVLGGKFSGDK